MEVGILIFFFMPFWGTKNNISGSNLENLYLTENLFPFSYIIFFCIILLPIISFIFGPTTSCRKGLN